MSLTKKVAYNTIIQAAGKVVGTLIGIVTIGLMLRYLEPERFGYYTTIVTYLSFFGIFVEFGFHLTTLQLVSEKKYDTQKLLSNIITLRLITTLSIFSIAPIIIWFFPYNNLIKWGVVIATISFIFIVLNQIMIAILQLHFNTDKAGLSEVVGRVVLLLFVMCGVYLNLGFLFIILAVVLGSMGNFIVNFTYARKFIQFGFAFDTHIWKDILIRAWPLGTTVILNLLYLKADILILTFTQTQRDVGIYGAPYRVLDILTTVPAMFMGLLLPVLTAKLVEKKKDDFERIFQKGFDALAFICVPVIAGLYATADKVMLLLGDVAFSESVLVLRILVFALLPLFLGGGIYGYTVVALRKQRDVIWIYALTAVCALGGYFYIIPRFSYIGAAYMTVAIEFLIAFLLIGFVSFYTRFVPNLTRFAKSLILSLFMGWVVIMLNTYSLIVQVSAGIVIYALGVYILNIIDKETILSVLGKTKT